MALHDLASPVSAFLHRCEVSGDKQVAKDRLYRAYCD